MGNTLSMIASSHDIIGAHVSDITKLTSVSRNSPMLIYVLNQAAMLVDFEVFG